MAPRGRQRIPTARGSPVGGAALGPREAPQRPTGLPAIRGTRGLRRWWEHIPRECLFHKNTYFNTQIVRCNAHAEASTRHVVSARTGMRGARAGPGPPQGWPRPRVPPRRAGHAPRVRGCRVPAGLPVLSARASGACVGTVPGDPFPEPLPGGPRSTGSPRPPALPAGRVRSAGPRLREPGDRRGARGS